MVVCVVVRKVVNHKAKLKVPLPPVLDFESAIPVSQVGGYLANNAKKGKDHTADGRR